MILSYFHNIVNLITQLSDTEMLELALNESSKIIPYVLSSRKAVKAYLKVFLSHLIIAVLFTHFCTEMS